MTEQRAAYKAQVAAMCAWDGKEFNATDRNNVWWAFGLPCCSRDHQQKTIQRELQDDDREVTAEDVNEQKELAQ